jgi:transposase InsO family protein
VAALIAAQRAEHRIPHAASCRALGVSQSWFYKWRGGALPSRAQRRERLKAEVARLFRLHDGKYGSPRITADLRETGWRVSENTVAALMRELGLAARRKKKRKATTRPGKGRWRAPDLVQRDFPAAALNRRWFGDGTQIATDEGKLHLVSVLEVPPAGYWDSPWVSGTTRRWPMARWPWRSRCAAVRCPAWYSTPTAAAAAVNTPPARSRPPAAGPASPSRWARPGSALDNAVIESWHSTLEFELRAVEHFTTKAAARANVAAWIGDYNTCRRHSACQMMPPVTYEKTLAA